MSDDDTIRPQTSINLPSTAEQQQSLTQKLSALELSMLEEKKSRSKMESEIQDVKAIEEKPYAFMDIMEDDRMVIEQMNEAASLHRQNFIRDLDKLAKVPGLEEDIIEFQTNMTRLQADYIKRKRMFKKRLEMIEKNFK